MNSAIILFFGLFLGSFCLSQGENVVPNGIRVVEEVEIFEDNSDVRRRESRQDDDEENEEEKEPERKRPALYPILFNLFGTVIGANETQVNQTVEKIVDRFNSIDPDSTTPLTSLPTKPPPKGSAGEEEEDEDEENRARRNNW